MFDRYYMSLLGHVSPTKMHESDMPVVVIQPEDRDQVNRLTQSLVDGLYAAGFHSLASNGIHPDNVQAALRSLVTPPKPTEPQGLGAVVEDAEGRRWERSTVHGSRLWVEVISGAQRGWGAMDPPVRVLSEGVTE